jgi:penicillin-binding protein 1A
VFGDKTLGIDKGARFMVPAELENQQNSADPLESIDMSLPAGQGEDIGSGSEQDYMSHDYIGPESQPVIEDDIKPKKNDSIQERRTNGTPIGAPADEPKKKKGFFNKLFGKKDK